MTESDFPNFRLAFDFNRGETNKPTAPEGKMVT